jgi:hypothetical protein
MSDHQALLGKEKDGLAMLDEPGMPGTWLNYLLRDTIEREKKCRGVDAPSEPSEPVDLFPDDDTTASASASASASGSASMSASASTSASASMSASASASGSASAAVEPAAPPPPARPPCGVDPKYRPRGLDGDPKGE